MRSCPPPVYSISNKYFHKTSMVHKSNFSHYILSSFLNSTWIPSLEKSAHIFPTYGNSKYQHRQIHLLHFSTKSTIFPMQNDHNFFLFSFSKYLYKSMARIQPSFLHSYLFRPWQYNTSFLLILFLLLSVSFQLFISNFLDVLNSAFCSRFSLGFPSFLQGLSHFQIVSSHLFSFSSCLFLYWSTSISAAFLTV